MLLLSVIRCEEAFETILTGTLGSKMGVLCRIEERRWERWMIRAL